MLQISMLKDKTSMICTRGNILDLHHRGAMGCCYTVRDERGVPLAAHDRITHMNVGDVRLDGCVVTQDLAVFSLHPDTSPSRIEMALPLAGVYRTPTTIKVVQPFSGQASPEAMEPVVEDLLERLYRYDVGVDASCTDWLKLFTLPHTTERVSTFVDFSRMEPI